jgi:hypothetical protein
MKIVPSTSAVVTTEAGFVSVIAGEEVDLPDAVAQRLVDAGLAVEVEVEKPKSAPRGKKVDGAPENKKA